MLWVSVLTRIALVPTMYVFMEKFGKLSPNTLLICVPEYRHRDTEGHKMGDSKTQRNLISIILSENLALIQPSLNQNSN